MYIEGTETYYRGTEQCARRARFLILVQCNDNGDEIRALVRKVALRQCGHFMMGSARVRGERIPISGAYGQDGLPRVVSPAVFAAAVPLPAELRERWNNGGGWNSAGSEAPAMAQWAKEVF